MKNSVKKNRNLTPETVEAIKNRISYFYYSMIMSIVYYRLEAPVDDKTFCEDYSPMATEMAMHMVEHIDSLIINTENKAIAIELPMVTIDDEGVFELSNMPITKPQIFYFDEEDGAYCCDTDVKTSDNTPVAYLDISEILANINF